TISEADQSAAIGDVLNTAATVPEGVVELYGEGAPAVSAQATATLDPDGDDNALIFTAVAFGEGGNDITITYVDPESEESALSVVVDGNSITVNLETDDSEPPDIVTTAADIITAIEASEAAAALVTVEGDVADADAGDNIGVVTAMEPTALA